MAALVTIQTPQMWASSSSSQKSTSQKAAQLAVTQSGAPDSSFLITFADCVGVTGAMDEHPGKPTTRRDEKKDQT